MAERCSFSEGGGELELLVLLPDRTTTHLAHYSCPMMDLLIQIASKENLKPSAYVVEALASSVYDEDHDSKPVIQYKPNTPVGMLNTQVIRLALKSTTAPKMAPPHSKPSQKINHSESFSNRVQNFNKMTGVSAVNICNDPDGFNKLSENTKRIKSRSNFITSTLPPQVTGNWDTTKTLMNTFRLQIHLPYDQLHVIRASPEYTIQDILDIIDEERGLRMERYNVFKTNEPNLSLNTKGTLKEYGITELTLKLLPEFEMRNVNPKKVKKENSSHFRSAFKSFFHQLKPSSRSNSVTELRPTVQIVRPKSEIQPRIHDTELAKPKPPPRKRGHAPPPPVQSTEHINSTMVTSRSHTASESSCESMGEGSVGGSAPATLPRRCRLGPESASTTNLAMEPPLPVLRRGVSDMAVNKPKFPRRKRLAPKPPTPISAEELVEDGLEEQAAAQKTGTPLNTDKSSHTATEPDNVHKIDKNNRDAESTDVIIINANMNDPVSDTIINEKHNDNSYETEGQIENAPPVQKVEVLIHEEKVEANDTQIDNRDQSHFVERNHVEKHVLPNGHEMISIESTIDTKDQEDQVNQELTDKNDNQLNEPYPDTVNSSEESLHDIDENNRISTNQFLSESIVSESDSFQNIEKNESSEPSFEIKIYEEDILVICPNIIEQSLISKDNEATIDVDNSTSKIAPQASHVASYQKVELPVALEMPKFKDFHSSPPVSNVNSYCEITPPFSNINDNPRRTKPLPHRSISAEPTVTTKPSVEQLLSQIKKIKQKAKENQSEMPNNRAPSMEFNRISLDAPIYQNGKSSEYPEIVAHIPKTESTQIPLTLSYDSANVEKLNSPVDCVTPPTSPILEHIPAMNGNNHTEAEKSRLVTDVVTKLYSIEKHIDSEPAKARPLPKMNFMLTSWAEEKRPPVVNRIADYGSRNSSTLVRGMSEMGAGVGATVVHKEPVFDRPLPFALSATLPRPFAKPAETTTVKPAVANKPPTIINMLEKVHISKQKDDQTHENIVTHINGRQSAFSKLNIYNMSPTISPDPIDYESHENGGSVNIPTKPSWELVKDASKKLEESKLNGEKVSSRSDNNDNHIFRSNNIVSKSKDIFEKNIDAVKVNKSVENGEKEQSVRHMYKYPKPLQFQLGTWSDKTKTLKIDAEGTLGHKSDPPLVTELDEETGFVDFVVDMFYTLQREHRLDSELVSKFCGCSALDSSRACSIDISHNQMSTGVTMNLNAKSHQHPDNLNQWHT